MVSRIARERLSAAVCLLSVAVVLMLASCAMASGRYPDAAKGYLFKSVRIAGEEFKYCVYVPPCYDPAKPTPTIIYMHGAGEVGTDGVRPTKLGIGVAAVLAPDKWPFIIIFPQKHSLKTTWLDDQVIVMATLGKTRRELNVDRARIYLTGASKGGNGTWAIAAEHPGLFAAIAPVCGGGTRKIAKELVHMPIWLFHGEKDKAVPVERARETMDWVNAAGGSCKATIYPDLGHQVWDRAYQNENLNEWFLQHRRDPPYYAPTE